MASFDEVLEPGQLKEAGVSKKTVADVLARVVIVAPEAVPQVDIATGAMHPGMPELPQGSVSRASKLLLKRRLLEAEHRRVVRPGRPIIPLRLGSGWSLVGVRIRHRAGRPVEVAGVLTPLDGSVIDQQVSRELGGTEDNEALVEVIADVVRELRKGDSRTMLGVGVALGGHVHQGSIVAVPSSEGGSYALGEELSKALQGQSTVVENDVNAHAVLEIWKKDPSTSDVDAHQLRFPQPHFAVVAVFDEGVGGALVIDRKLYRGSHGMAGEIGHVTVDHSRPHRDPSGNRRSREPGLKGFDDRCPCTEGPTAKANGGRRGYGHVDALATPSRITGELGLAPAKFQQAADRPATAPDGDLTREGEVFRIAGQALGRGIAALLNLTNPGNFLLLLPPELAHPTVGTAAAEYTKAVEHTLDEACYSSCAADARAGRDALLVERVDPDDAFDGARAAATCVLDSFISYARGEETESLAEASAG
jgi:predicted NBD/HSP70 family sugar kinase